MTDIDLNKGVIENADGPDQPIADHGIETEEISVYFRNLEESLIHHISAAQAVFGAVAWMTNEAILGALADVENVSIIVQKEDFLRPDLNTKPGWPHRLRQLYAALSCDLTRYDLKNRIGMMSFASDPSIEPVRCVGNFNREKKPAAPRMHNKFLVLANVADPDKQGERQINPYAVWTGSFNFSKNATRSFENAMLVTNQKVVDAYFSEYGEIAAMSEKLDWTSDWVAPEWRIGT